MQHFKIFLLTGIVFFISAINAQSNSEESIMLNVNQLNTATYIALQPLARQEENLEFFLRQGAQLVLENEPNTKLWFALRTNDNKFGIIDVFPNDAARSEHFNGVVANALKENAETLVANGWEKGVLSNISNYNIFSRYLSANVKMSREATLIKLHAKPGKQAELQSLLTKAAVMVEENEPNTLFWCAMKLDEGTFVIFDTFGSESGRTEHFSSQAALALQKFSNQLIDGGWEQGVLNNIQNFKIIAQK